LKCIPELKVSDSLLYILAFFSDRASISYTTSSYTTAASAWTLGTAAVTGLAEVKFNLPYTQSDWQTNTASINLQGRLISLGVTIKYAGALTDRSGIIITTADPSCRDLNGLQDSTAMAQHQTVKYINNQTDVAYLTVYPRKEFQRELQSHSENVGVCLPEYPTDTTTGYYDITAAGNSKAPPVGVALIYAKAGAQFTVEYTAYYEFAGSLVGFCLCLRRLCLAAVIQLMVLSMQHTKFTLKLVTYHHLSIFLMFW